MQASCLFLALQCVSLLVAATQISSSRLSLISNLSVCFLRLDSFGVIRILGLGIAVGCHTKTRLVSTLLKSELFRFYHLLLFQGYFSISHTLAFRVTRIPWLGVAGGCHTTTRFNSMLLKSELFRLHHLLFCHRYYAVSLTLTFRVIRFLWFDTAGGCSKKARLTSTLFKSELFGLHHFLIFHGYFFVSLTMTFGVIRFLWLGMLLAATQRLVLSAGFSRLNCFASLIFCSFTSTSSSVSLWLSMSFVFFNSILTFEGLAFPYT